MINYLTHWRGFSHLKEFLPSHIADWIFYAKDDKDLEKLFEELIENEFWTDKQLDDLCSKGEILPRNEYTTYKVEEINRGIPKPIKNEFWIKKIGKQLRDFFFYGDGEEELIPSQGPAPSP